jgi:hypothetical protein
LLVRRVREALADKLICIGTSATMATDGTEWSATPRSPSVASPVRHQDYQYRNIITETLRRTTPETQTDKTVAPLLATPSGPAYPMA